MNFYKIWEQINEAAEHYALSLFKALKDNPDTDLWVHFTRGVSYPPQPKIGIRPYNSCFS